jgi:hypothetical protein
VENPSIANVKLGLHTDSAYLGKCTTLPYKTTPIMVQVLTIILCAKYFGIICTNIDADLKDFSGVSNSSTNYAKKVL